MNFKIIQIINKNNVFDSTRIKTKSNYFSYPIKKKMTTEKTQETNKLKKKTII